jgi:hypothetical protein
MVKPTVVACHNTEKIIFFGIFEVMVFAELYGLQSFNAVPNSHKFFDNLGFQSFPELHCALFQVLLEFGPASRVCLA